MVCSRSPLPDTASGRFGHVVKEDYSQLGAKLSTLPCFASIGFLTCRLGDRKNSSLRRHNTLAGDRSMPCACKVGEVSSSADLLALLGAVA
ncbi:unnamed protein product [Nippostrongylus brasiliensis]|uniref:Uncharacterized protein n=1 Tax=Nippostrongylus brasiliensis TaxID=27835 RepID=A0A0N4YMR1_NIPBR|nr:unnamed protein product [Nippostrongylus brasiliensis]